MKKPALVSFILSVYNDEKYIARAIDSMLGQDYLNFEIVLVDDGSTDGTSGILKKYSELHHLIKIIHNNDNRGLTRCLNDAILLSSGEFVARLDSDDFSFPERLKLQVRAMKEDSSIGVVASPVIISMIKNSNQQTQYLNEHQIRRKLKYVNCLQHSSVLIRRSVLDEIGLYNNSFYTSQDYDLWLRVLDAGYKICMIDKPLVERTILNNSISRRKLFKQAYNSFKIRKNHNTVPLFINIILFSHQLLFGFGSNIVGRILGK